MKLLALYLGIVIIGYFIGSWMKKNNKKISFIGKLQSVSIGILIVLMGMRLGVDKEIIKGLSAIGGTAFLLTIFVMAGSVLGVFFVRKIIGLDGKGVKNHD